jgi:hypothetical protein
VFLLILIKISDDSTSTEARQEARSAQDPSKKIMASRMFDVKFPCDTQLTFGPLTFATGEDGDLKMLLPGPAPEHVTPTSSSASGRSYVGSYRCARNYICTAKIVRDIPVVTSIIRPLARASSSSTSASIPDSDSFDDYPEIGANAYGEPAKYDHFIYMVASNGDRKQHLQQISHHREIRGVQCPNTEWWLGSEPESRFQCCSGLGNYGNHPAHGARWLPSCCPSSERG